MRRARISPLLLTGLLAGACLASPARAQTVPAAPAAADSVPADSARISARGALIRSLVLPGWGQAYVGAPGRGAVYFAMEAGSLWMVMKSWRQRAAAQRLEESLRPAQGSASTARLPLAEARGQQVEDWITMSIFLLFFSGADAYVAAQLEDFTEHVGAVPDAEGALRLEARLPLGRRR